jgi:hypothetical protein
MIGKIRTSRPHIHDMHAASERSLLENLKMMELATLLFTFAAMQV